MSGVIADFDVKEANVYKKNVERKVGTIYKGSKPNQTFFYLFLFFSRYGLYR